MTAARRGGMRSCAWKRRRRERKSLIGTADLNSVRPAMSWAERLAAWSRFCWRRACSAQSEVRASATGMRQRPLRVWRLQPPSGDAVRAWESLSGLELVIVLVIFVPRFSENGKQEMEIFFSEIRNATPLFT